MASFELELAKLLSPPGSHFVNALLLLPKKASDDFFDEEVDEDVLFELSKLFSNVTAQEITPFIKLIDKWGLSTQKHIANGGNLREYPDFFRSVGVVTIDPDAFVSSAKSRNTITRTPFNARKFIFACFLLCKHNKNSSTPFVAAQLLTSILRLPGNRAFFQSLAVRAIFELIKQWGESYIQFVAQVGSRALKGARGTSSSTKKQGIIAASEASKARSLAKRKAEAAARKSANDDDTGSEDEKEDPKEADRVIALAWLRTRTVNEAVLRLLQALRVTFTLHEGQSARRSSVHTNNNMDSNSMALAQAPKCIDLTFSLQSHLDILVLAMESFTDATRASAADLVQQSSLDTSFLVEIQTEAFHGLKVLAGIDSHVSGALGFEILLKTLLPSVLLSYTDVGSQASVPRYLLNVRAFTLEFIQEIVPEFQDADARRIHQLFELDRQERQKRAVADAKAEADNDRASQNAAKAEALAKFQEQEHMERDAGFTSDFEDDNDSIEKLCSSAANLKSTPLFSSKQKQNSKQEQSQNRDKTKNKIKTMTKNKSVKKEGGDSDSDSDSDDDSSSGSEDEGNTAAKSESTGMVDDEFDSHFEKVEKERIRIAKIDQLRALRVSVIAHRRNLTGPTVYRAMKIFQEHVCMRATDRAKLRHLATNSVAALTAAMPSTLEAVAHFVHTLSRSNRSLQRQQAVELAYALLCTQGLFSLKDSKSNGGQKSLIVAPVLFLLAVLLERIYDKIPTVKSKAVTLLASLISFVSDNAGEDRDAIIGTETMTDTKDFPVEEDDDILLSYQKKRSHHQISPQEQIRIDKSIIRTQFALVFSGLADEFVTLHNVAASFSPSGAGALTWQATVADVERFEMFRTTIASLMITTPHTVRRRTLEYHQDHEVMKGLGMVGAADTSEGAAKADPSALSALDESHNLTIDLKFHLINSILEKYSYDKPSMISNNRGTKEITKILAEMPFHPGLPGVQRLLAAVRLRAVDQRPGVRRCAMACMEAILVSSKAIPSNFLQPTKSSLTSLSSRNRSQHGQPSSSSSTASSSSTVSTVPTTSPHVPSPLELFTAEDFQTFFERCSDLTSGVRRQALQSVTSLLEAFPDDVRVQRMWFGAVMPLTCDSETFVMERARSSLITIVLHPWIEAVRKITVNHRLKQRELDQKNAIKSVEKDSDSENDSENDDNENPPEKQVTEFESKFLASSSDDDIIPETWVLDVLASCDTSVVHFFQKALGEIIQRAIVPSATSSDAELASSLYKTVNIALDGPCAGQKGFWFVAEELALVAPYLIRSDVALAAFQICQIAFRQTRDKKNKKRKAQKQTQSLSSVLPIDAIGLTADDLLDQQLSKDSRLEMETESDSDNDNDNDDNGDNDDDVEEMTTLNTSYDEYEQYVMSPRPPGMFTPARNNTGKEGQNVNVKSEPREYHLVLGDPPCPEEDSLARSLRVLQLCMSAFAIPKQKVSIPPGFPSDGGRHATTIPGHREGKICAMMTIHSRKLFSMGLPNSVALKLSAQLYSSLAERNPGRIDPLSVSQAKVRALYAVTLYLKSKQSDSHPKKRSGSKSKKSTRAPKRQRRSDGDDDGDGDDNDDNEEMMDQDDDQDDFEEHQNPDESSHHNTIPVWEESLMKDSRAVLVDYLLQGASISLRSVAYRIFLLGEIILVSDVAPRFLSQETITLIQAFLPRTLLRFVKRKTKRDPNETVVTGPDVTTETNPDSVTPNGNDNDNEHGDDKKQDDSTSRGEDQASLRVQLKLPAWLRGFAFVALGKFCLKDKTLAEQSISVFIRELDSMIPQTLSPYTSAVELAILTKNLVQTSGTNQTIRHDAEFTQKSEEDVIVRNNVLAVLCDLCRTFTSIIDPYIGSISMCLRDSSPLVRRHCVIVLSQLLLEDFIKWKGILYFRLLSSVLDRDNSVSSAAREVIHQILRQKGTQTENRCVQTFVESIFFFNDCSAHPSFNQFLISEIEEADTEDSEFLFGGTKLAIESTSVLAARAQAKSRNAFFSLRGPYNVALRKELFEFLAKTATSDLQKITIISHITKNVIGAVNDRTLPLPLNMGEIDETSAIGRAGRRRAMAHHESNSNMNINAHSGVSRHIEEYLTSSRIQLDDVSRDSVRAVLLDSLYVLRSPLLRISTSTSIGSAKEVESEGDALADHLRAQSKLAGSLMKKALINGIFPELLEFKRRVEPIRSLSMVLRELMIYLRELMTLHGNDLAETFEMNKDLKEELDYDIRQWNELEAAERKEAEERAAQAKLLRQQQFKVQNQAQMQSQEQGQDGQVQRFELPNDDIPSLPSPTVMADDVHSAETDLQSSSSDATLFSSPVKVERGPIVKQELVDPAPVASSVVSPVQPQIHSSEHMVREKAQSRSRKQLQPAEPPVQRRPTRRQPVKQEEVNSDAETEVETDSD